MEKIEQLTQISAAGNIKEVARVCTPLKTIDISYFVYIEKDRNNQALWLSNDRHLVDIGQGLSEKELFNTLFLRKIVRTPGWYVWDDVFLNNMCIKSLKDSHLHSGISFVTTHNNYTRMYHFGSKTNNKFNHNVMWQLDLLKKFIFYFDLKMKVIIKQGVRHPLPPSFIKSLNFDQKISQRSQAKLDNFLQAIDIHNIQVNLAKIRYQLTTREQECLYHLLNGKATKEIAYNMGLSVRTIENHFQRVRRKAGCRTTLELIVKIQQLNA